eukprot:9137639-Pyramimonas_sp.AAC.1
MFGTMFGGTWLGRPTTVRALPQETLARNPALRTRARGAPEGKPRARRTQQLLQRLREVTAQREERRNPGYSDEKHMVS